MAVARGELWFAPDRRMANIDLDDPVGLIDAFRDRVEGFFLEPARHLKTMAQEEASLFASALICAATIESLARFDPTVRNSNQPIADWLYVNIPQFCRDVGGKSAATYFDERFRNGLVHEGYVASLGRLGNLDEVVTIDRDVVTVDPFLLIEEIANWLSRFQDDLKDNRRDVRAFQHRMKELFEAEINRARCEDAA
jgi:hypothetical protein